MITTTSPDKTCHAGFRWCNGEHDVDIDGTNYHRAAISPSELLTVQVFANTDYPDAPDELEVELQVHDDPPLTIEQAQQVAREILYTVGSL